MTNFSTPTSSVFSLSDPLFWLSPCDEDSALSISVPGNQEWASIRDGSLKLGVFSVRHPTDDELIELVTMGKRGDIKLACNSVSSTQCVFLMNRSSGHVLLLDKSDESNTAVSGEDTWPLPSVTSPTPRQVILHPDNDDICISMGGAKSDRLIFKLEWNRHHQYIKERRGTVPPPLIPPVPSHSAAGYASSALSNEAEGSYYNPSLSSTETVHGGSPEPNRVRDCSEVRLITRGGTRTTYLDLGNIGSGSYGSVSKVLDVHTGDVLARKYALSSHPGQQSDDASIRLEREIGLVSRLDHKHIVKYVLHDLLDSGEVILYMKLEQGTLNDLPELAKSPIPISIYRDLPAHMLKALHHIEYRRMLHRDIKMDNILFSKNPRYEDGFIFKLSDFGLGNRVTHAQSTGIGALLYRAPEVQRRQPSSHKSDEWSMFFTLLEALNIRGFKDRLKKLDDHEFSMRKVVDLVQEVRRELDDPVFKHLQDMGALDPEDRPTAEKVLGRLGIRCDGRGGTREC